MPFFPNPRKLVPTKLNEFTKLQLSAPIISKVASANPVHGEVVYWIQHYVIKFVSDLRQVGGFLRVLGLPPPIKLTTTIELKYS